jgi:two-component system sensor histidine kinase RegB
MLLTAMNLIGLTVLALWHLPLPWEEPAHQQMLPPILPLAPPSAPLYAFGVWLSLSLSAVFITVYVFRAAAEARRFAGALAAAQMALAREQRLSSLGALAAAAAHELGSPLGTIAVVAKELAYELPPDSPQGEDVALLQSQVARCRGILAELARKPEADGGDPFERLPLTALIEAAAAPHRLDSIALAIEPRPTVGVAEPVLRRSPEIIHGLGNLIQNALQFARRQVTVTAGWDGRGIAVTVRDDGPGFPPQLLGRIGEPYLSVRGDRTGPDGNMGLGIFIAQTLLEKTGASVAYSNDKAGGARIAVRWSIPTQETPQWTPFP